MKSVEYKWPDGTWHNQSFEDYLNSSVSKTRIFYERLRFIFYKLSFFFKNFKRIEVRKSLDGGGKFKYTSNFTLSFNVNTENRY